MVRVVHHRPSDVRAFGTADPPHHLSPRLSQLRIEHDLTAHGVDTGARGAAWLAFGGHRYLPQSEI